MKKKKKDSYNLFPTAKDEREIRKKQSFQTSLAFLDHDFLLRRELRPIRLQLELLRTELAQQDLGINSTIVFYGSARIMSPEDASQAMTVAEKALENDPNDLLAQKAFTKARQQMSNAKYYTAARRLARLVSEAYHSRKEDDLRECVVVTGGGPGIMEAANRGAYDANARSIGLNILLPHEEQSNRYVTPELSFQFHYFAIRKMHFLIRARAIVVFPGGFGTLDELFEVLTLIQTQKIQPLPIILYGREFWNSLINFEYMSELGTISPQDVNYFQITDTVEETWEKLQNGLKGSDIET